MLYRAQNGRIADGIVARRDVGGGGDGAGVYLTDGVFLYRFVGSVENGGGELVELEDCYWLDVVQVPVSEVLARRLRVVTATPIDG